MSQFYSLPWITQQFFDDNGNPLSGGKVWSYEAGATGSFTDPDGKTVTVTNGLITSIV